MRKKLICIMSITLLVLSVGAAEQPEPLGSQFQVNTYVDSYQQNPVIAMAPSGGSASGAYVVVWGSDGSSGSDSSGFSVQARMFDIAGEPVSDDFQVNTYTSAGQCIPAVSATPNGELIIVWSSNGSSGTDDSWGSVQGRLYSSSGEPLSDEIQINTTTYLSQDSPDVAINPNGSFVVIWEHGGPGNTDPYSGIQGQRFDADGEPAGGEFQVNSVTDGYQTSPAVAMAADGGFVAVWESSSLPAVEESIEGRVYDADGAPLGGQLQVNTTPPDRGHQSYPDVSVASSGEIVVVWTSSDPATYTSIRARLLDRDGVPIGADFKIPSSDNGRNASVVRTHNRDFLVVWSTTDCSPSPCQSNIYGQWLLSNGTPLGSRIDISDAGFPSFSGTDVAVHPNGNFMVVWSSSGSTGSDSSFSSIQARAFTGMLFAEDFEFENRFDEY
jgi:hypothetical protein